MRERYLIYSLESENSAMEERGVSSCYKEVGRAIPFGISVSSTWHRAVPPSIVGRNVPTLAGEWRHSIHCWECDMSLSPSAVGRITNSSRRIKPLHPLLGECSFGSLPLALNQIPMESGPFSTASVHRWMRSNMSLYLMVFDKEWGKYIDAVITRIPNEPEAKINKDPLHEISDIHEQKLKLHQPFLDKLRSNFEQEELESEVANATKLDEDAYDGLADLQRLTYEIGNMHDNFRLMPDSQRREMTPKPAMKMAAMFGG
ncbi:Alpha and gamma adaptin binding protein p34 [Musa troglodytarum]|uniref:Alpha and gamma adaptin binding protein p34 n=1 Tax=Musa troglodytarum TaxID=320322 RepID=A0A9E7F6U2_9LILI|nr:Alpha and gamma adaptin binding protein p34 [Musa troglodytarum]